MTDQEVTDAYSGAFDGPRLEVKKPVAYLHFPEELLEDPDVQADTAEMEEVFEKFKDYYVTKDSGERVSYSTGMQRDVNKGKPRFDLLLPEGVRFEDQLITRWAALMARGAEKYTPRNWELAGTQEEYDRFRDSAFRHLIQWLCGEKDEDHAVAVLFNIMGAEYVKEKLV